MFGADENSPSSRVGISFPLGGTIQNEGSIHPLLKAADTRGKSRVGARLYSDMSAANDANDPYSFSP